MTFESSVSPGVYVHRPGPRAAEFYPPRFGLPARSDPWCWRSTQGAKIRKKPPTQKADARSCNHVVLSSNCRPPARGLALGGAPGVLGPGNRRYNPGGGLIDLQNECRIKGRPAAPGPGKSWPVRRNLRASERKGRPPDDHGAAPGATTRAGWECRSMARLPGDGFQAQRRSPPRARTPMKPRGPEAGPTRQKGRPIIDHEV